MTHHEYRLFAKQIKYLLDYQEELDELVKEVCEDLKKRETSETNDIDAILVKIRMLAQKYRIMKIKSIIARQFLAGYED